MSEASTLPDDAFRSCTLDFIQRVSSTALNGSSDRRIELRALASRYLDTSQDINMQELLVLLHSQYDLIKLDCFGRVLLEDITARFYRTAGGVGVTGVKAGFGMGGSGSSNEVQRGSMAVGFEEDTVGVGAHVGDGDAMPTELKDDDFGVVVDEAEKAKKPQNEAGYVVGWERRC